MFKDMLNESLNAPIPKINSGLTSIIKRNRIKVVLHYEDGSYRIFFKKKGKDSYKLDIMGFTYIIIYDAIVKGKISEIHYYFNNPFPIKFGYLKSKVKSSDLPDELFDKFNSSDLHQLDVTIDAQVLKACMESNAIKNMMKSDGMDTKGLITIIIVVSIVLIVILQATGTVDIIGFFKPG